MIEGKRCSVCKKEWNEVELFEGISGAEMIMICKSCANREGIPTINKPSVEQIKKTKEIKSVRERMETLSGMRDRTHISEDQEAFQRNLHKLKAPPKKETNPFVLDNYYWAANMGRRRKKISITQAAKAMGIKPELIEQTEQGKIPQDFEEVFDKMEKFYGIQLLKNKAQKIHFVKTREEEEKILEEVKEKMNKDKVLLKELKKEDTEDDEERKSGIQMTRKKEIDFSRRENLENITLNDLVEMKNKKKRIDEARRIREEIEEMIGEDLDLDNDEL